MMNVRSNVAALAGLLVLFLGMAACQPSEDTSPASDASAETSRDRPGEAAALPDAAEKAREAERRLEESGAGRLLLEAIDAHGGLEAWYAAPTSSYTWEYANSDVGLQFKSYMVVANRARTAYHDLMSVGPFDAPQPVDGAYAWDGEQAWIVPDSITSVNPHFWATTGYYFEQIPFVLADPGVTVESLPDATLDGTTYTMIRAGYTEGTGYSDDDTYTLYIHPETRQVDAIRYTVTYGQDLPDGAEPSETLFYYEDYVTVDGLTVAKHFRGYRFSGGERGARRSEAWADSISFRRPFDASRLEAPEGARIVTPPPVSSPAS